MNSMLNNSNSTNRPSMSNTQPAPDLTYSHVLMGIIGGMCIITNAFIFITIVRRKKLRTPANDILQSMFISGFLFGAVYILPKWTNLEYLRWPIYCSLSGPIGVHFTLIFNFHQCLICIDKLLALRWPLKYRISISHCKMITVIIVIWLVAAFAAFSPLMFFRPISNVYCIQRSRDVEKEALYLKIIYGLVFFVPLILMVISYTGIIVIVNSRTRMDRYRSDKHIDQNFFSITIKTAKQMAVIAGAFVVLWLPFIAISLYAVSNPFALFFQRSWFQPLFETLRFLAFSYPAINPIFCAYYVNSIRKALYQDVGRKLTVVKKPPYSNTNSTNLPLKTTSQSF
ncbi:Trace amine-associated receptor 7b [Trichoplax sp. H2]|nr:Trace amine-associated receptor 7b [Trichoplax sp. H2]|eukprot:RDD39085.1 Trace amine-associated receptor 7b [Trichoplax sp. H2]